MRPFRVPLRSDFGPAEAVAWLRGEERPFALIGEWLGGLAILGSRPVRIGEHRCDPFSVIDEQPEIEPGEAVVGGAWVGWLGYGLGARIEKLPPSPPAPALRAPFSLAFYDHLVLYDGGQWWFEGLWTEDRDAELHERQRVWEARLRTPPPALGALLPSPFVLAGNGVAGHLAAVTDGRRRIFAGELYEANLCARLEARYDGDPLDLFARALPRAQPRFGALVDGVVSLSPERFLRRDGRRVWTEPIKGTRPRLGTESERRAARDELLASTKDAAEHVMIVDLMRNDLGRVCAYGTVEAQPPRVEPHAGVWQLVSTVSGELREEVGDGELLRATFPPGSVTGAPKVQAMKVIAALEATRREAYTGAIGIASPIAGLDMNVVIRTFETSGDRIWIGVGGAVVADSDPEQELAEALAKAAGPVAAIGGRVAAIGGHGAAIGGHGAEPARRPLRRRSPVRRALSIGSRPDPAWGVFDTMLVDDGQPVGIELHLNRLAASVRELYGARLAPTVLAGVQTAAAQAVARSRLRIDVDVDGSASLTLSSAISPRTMPARLAPFSLPGGLGAHKWRDRRLLEALAAVAPGTVPLLIDTDDLVLEAAYANVWILDGDVLITPPADGRILPGTVRAALLGGEVPVHDAAGAREVRAEPIDFSRLVGAESVFLSSSISGLHPAELDVRGVDRPRANPVPAAAPL